MNGTNDGHGMREDLAGLNRRFLRIALGGVPGPLAVNPAALAGLDEAARDRLAGLPFALFSFGFGADGSWETFRVHGVRDADPCPAVDPERERFVLLSLAFIRQAVRTDARRAAALAGVPGPVGAWLAGLEVGALAVLAPRAASLLRWRFPTQASLWASLVSSCRDPDASLLPVVRAAAIQWTIRRALALQEEACAAARGFRSGAP